MEDLSVFNCWWEGTSRKGEADDQVEIVLGESPSEGGMG